MVINFDGQLLATISYPSVTFTAMAIDRETCHIVLGDSSGTLYVYHMGKLEFRQKLDSPDTI